jgi:2-oxoglutarate dehydrogenase E2 component (dihydrolipoamide succinyltransferase)
MNFDCFGLIIFDVSNKVNVGSDLYVIDTSATELPVSSEVVGDKPAPQKPSSASSEAITVPVPIMGESITQGVLASWTSKVGDFVNADDVVATIETDKV